MQKNYRNNRIPDLRRKANYKHEINLEDMRYLAIRYFIPVVIMVTIIIIGAMIVAATPNSNFPNNI